MTMSQNTPTKDTVIEEQELLSCEICLESVPVSEAGNVEGEEYVAFFFGLECYEQWLSQQENIEDNK